MIIKPIDRIRFTQLPMGDKSLTHRALILGALAEGVTHIQNVGVCLDTMSTINCLRQLGAKITLNGQYATVTGIVKPNTDCVLDCGNSGTTMQLLAGVVAGLGIGAKFTGDSSLARRPKQCLSALQLMGAVIEYSDDCLFEIMPSYLKGITYTQTAVSAQVKSAILLAGLLAEGKTVYIEPQLTRDHTERMLMYYGANIDREETAITITHSSLSAREIYIPNDISTCAYFIALATQKGKLLLKDVLLNPTRLGFIELLKYSGAKIKILSVKSNGFEEYGDILIKKSHIRRLNTDRLAVTNTIDELPIAMLLSCLTNRKTHFDGIRRLALKESNRILSMTNLINAVGCHAHCDNDSMIIDKSKHIIGGNVVTNADHRIAMCACLAGLLCTTQVDVDNVQCIDVSCPAFLRMLNLGINKPTTDGVSVCD
ncbi:MAG: 3-phosphoshikimate 1-carboxyvinyltransferase [Clostridia bacterium]|nr:3-phosphoshikimate 1-carboxyvinyltransferase [Clostridia bacterium]